MCYKTLSVQVEEQVVIITFCRPEKLNALNTNMCDEIVSVLDEIERNTKIKAVILTGKGEKAFIAGADIDMIQQITSAIRGSEFSQEGHNMLFKLERLPKPVIVAVNGYALGGGCELAMAGDIRIASDKAQFGLPEINIGIFPGSGGTQRLPRLVGIGNAKRLMMTGEIISAEEALRIGLVEYLVPHDQLMKKAKALAYKMANKPSIALALLKKTIQDGMNVDLEQGCIIESLNFGLVLTTEDSREGLTAFLEKRKPRFNGR